MPIQSRARSSEVIATGASLRRDVWPLWGSRGPETAVEPRCVWCACRRFRPLIELQIRERVRGRHRNPEAIGETGRGLTIAAGGEAGGAVRWQCELGDRAVGRHAADDVALGVPDV